MNPSFLRLERHVMSAEGFRESPYYCPKGVPTIGHGTTRILDEPVRMDMPPISPHAARQLLRADLYQALIDAQQLFGRLGEMEPARQEVIIDMAYNLGRYRLSRFVSMRAAAEVLDYEEMANQMVYSKWYVDVGRRAERLVEQMRTGEV